MVDKIDTLIAELKSLKIREADIIAQLETAAAEQRRGQRRETNTDTRVVVSGTNALARGDRVRITNRVRKPATWNNDIRWEEDKERSATVTKVTPDQVHIVTDNGVRTWRAPNNLKKC